MYGKQYATLRGTRYGTGICALRLCGTGNLSFEFAVLRIVVGIPLSAGTGTIPKNRGFTAFLFPRIPLMIFAKVRSFVAIVLYFLFSRCEMRCCSFDIVSIVTTEA